MIFTDNMQIPVGAPHAFTAEKFMDFVYDPEIQAEIASLRQLRAAGEGRRRRSSRRSDPKLAENQLIFPGPDAQERTTSRRSRRRTRRRSTPPSSARSARSRQSAEAGAAGGASSRGGAALLPYLLLAPGLLWLVLFFAVPLYYMARQSRSSSGTIFTGLPLHLALPDLHGRDLELRRAAHPLVRVRGRRDADRAR